MVHALPGVLVFMILVQTHHTWIKETTLPKAPWERSLSDKAAPRERSLSDKVPRERTLSEKHEGKNSTSLQGNTESIYLLKISKTGSSTLASIFLKKAWLKQKTIATYWEEPVLTDPHIVPNPSPVISYLVPPFKVGVSSKFDMIVHHSTHIKRDIDLVLKSPIMKITMLRHPFSRFKSYVNTEPSFVHHLRKFRGDKAKVFLDSYQNKGWMEKVGLTWTNLERFWLTYFFNIKQNIDKTSLLKMLSEVKKDFLVGLTEEYPMSVVLFKRKLNLSFQEILYMHIRMQRYKQDRSQTERLAKEFCSMSPTDCFIYDYLNTSFWLTVNQLPNDFFGEVKHFEDTLVKTSAYCKHIIWDIRRHYKSRYYDPYSVSNTKPLVIERSKWHEQFQYTAQDCLLTLLAERAMYPLLYFRQNPQVDCNTIKNCSFGSTLKLCKLTCNIHRMDTPTLLETLVSTLTNFFFW